MNQPSNLPIADPAEVEKARAFLESQHQAVRDDVANMVEHGVPAAIPTALQERVEDVAADTTHEPNLTAIDHLIAEAKTKLGVQIGDSTVEHPYVVADDANILNALSAERAAIARQIKMLEERKTEIDGIAKALLGDAHDLKANGVTVVTFRPSTVRGLNQTAVKQLFPDLPKNAKFYVDSERRAINWT